MRERGVPSMSSSRSSGARAERLPEGTATHRSQLFGTGLGGGGASTAERGGSSMQQALEEDNDRLTDELQAKVTALRFASQSIHDEVSEHNRMLSGMVRRRPAPLFPLASFSARCFTPPLARTPCLQTTDFDRTGNLLSGSLQRLDGLLRQGRQGYMCYMIFFAVVVFLMLWLVMKKR